MKTKLSIYLALILALLSCSLFSKPAASPSQENPEAPESQLMQNALLPDPTVGLDGLDSYHQELTISFQGAMDGATYEWTNAHQHDVWKKASADFWMLKTNETGAAPTDMLVGTVDQAQYSRLWAGAPCQVWWGTTAEGAEENFQPAGLLPPIAEAAEAGTETVNDVLARHYVVDEKESDATVAGDFWLAEPGGYVVRYVLTVSGEEGEQRFEYDLSQVNSTGEVVYPEDCLPVLVDFPVMDGARNLHRLPAAVDYTVSAETSAISQFYQDQLVAQGWMFVNAHDNDPKNVLLIFTNKDQGKVASILLSTRDSGVWVSVILRPWESTSGEVPVP